MTVARRSLCGLVFGLLAAITACHAAAPAPFAASGFEAAEGGYQIHPLPGAAPGPSSVLPPVWQLDNYFVDPSTHALTPKRGPEYRAQYELDENGDGITDVHETAALYDLRFVHAELQAVLWVRAFPVARAFAHVDMDVLLKDYVEEISHVGYEAVRFDTRVTNEPPRFATNITRETLGKLAGQDAVDADVEVAERAQLPINQNTSWRRMRLILARGPAPHITSSGQSFPMMIVLAYASRPEHFVEAQADFENLLARFSIGQAAGFVPVAWPHGPPITPPLPNFAPPAPAPPSTPPAN